MLCCVLSFARFLSYEPSEQEVWDTLYIWILILTWIYIFWNIRRVCFRKICRPFLLISQVSDCSRVVDRGVYRETQKGLRGGRRRRTANHDPSVCLSGIFFDLGTSMCADDMSIIIQYFSTRLPAITFYDEVSFFTSFDTGTPPSKLKTKAKKTCKWMSDAGVTDHIGSKGTDLRGFVGRRKER